MGRRESEERELGEEGREDIVRERKGEEKRHTSPDGRGRGDGERER